MTVKKQRTRSTKSKTTANEAPQNQDAGKIKDPEEWTTGDEPMTGAQRSYLHTLAHEAGEEPQDDLTKAEASQQIDELQEKTGRGARRKGK